MPNPHIISTAVTTFMICKNMSEQASADDILHILCYIILSSEAQNLSGQIRYINTFLYTQMENFEKKMFYLKNYEIALEYLSGVTLGNANNNDDGESDVEWEEISTPPSTEFIN